MEVPCVLRNDGVISLAFFLSEMEGAAVNQSPNRVARLPQKGRSSARSVEDIFFRN